MAGTLFTKTHEWVKLNGDIATVGLSDYAQGELGDIVFVEMPEVDEEVDAEDSIGSIESVKTVSDYYAPLTGQITELNETLEDTPELLNEEPMTDGWIFKMKISDKDEIEDLMDEKDYKDYLRELQEEGE
ncbi:MAG: glycine cleavage system protein H [Candidatus Muiribacterium halophilum]|uniref:Glycine cleavage system H protein n=1 Tax=Muiribacterium halophilum TaxID=2053465 RepID=A0A2N5ZEA9_MUIH1|nr:MAG: glycine cleavage system protein H [Candidatus Muirbacterium halophilum]